MPDETPPPAPPAVSPNVSEFKTDFNISEEFGTAKKNLPPIKIVLIGAGIILLGWAIAALVQRPRSSATGSLDDVASVEVPNQNLVMVAINISVHNGGTKPYWIHTIQAELQTANGNFTTDAVSPADFDRYYQAFPALKQYAIDPLRRETKILPGGEIKGTIIVGFPVTADTFANRKLLKISIQPYDQPAPLVLTK